MSQRAKFYFVYQNWYHWERLRNDVLKQSDCVCPCSCFLMDLDSFILGELYDCSSDCSQYETLSINLEHGLPLL